MDGREGLDGSGDIDEREDRDALVLMMEDFRVVQDCSSICDCSLTSEKTSKNDKIKVIEYILSDGGMRFGWVQRSEFGSNREKETN